MWSRRYVGRENFLKTRFFFFKIVWNTVVYRTLWNTNKDRNSINFSQKIAFFFCFEKKLYTNHVKQCGRVAI